MFRILLASAGLVSVAGCSGGSPIVEQYGSETVFGRTTSGLYVLEESYFQGDVYCRAMLEPPRVVESTATEMTNWFDVLSTEFPADSGWVYSSAIAPLSDSTLRVKTYDVQGGASRVGAEFHVEYRPTANDPSTEIHWIQVIDNNHRLGGGGGHGITDNKVDRAGALPFYDEVGAAESGTCSPDCDFYDFPNRTDGLRSHRWRAVLYVVEAPASGPGAVMLRAPPMTWGWGNTCLSRETLEQLFRLLRPARMLTDGVFAPGRRVSTDLVEPAPFSVSPSGGEAVLEELMLAFEIGPAPEVPISAEADVVRVTVRGDGVFSSVDLGGEAVEGAELLLAEGEGWYQPAAREFSAVAPGELVAPGSPPFPITAYLYGTVAQDGRSVTLRPEETILVESVEE